LCGLLLGCGNASPPPRQEAPPVSASAQGAPTPSSTAPAPPASVDAVAPADAGVPADAGEAPLPTASVPFAPDNKLEPTEGPELAERAKGLFEAIVKDAPERAEAFWFPREPFIPLKDVKDPGKYWDQLHRTYVNDVHALHRKRKSWDGAEFVRFEGWSRPKWVKPGDEANKIGYHRAFHGKLRYKVDGEEGEIDVHTIITWQGRWFITHLRKFKK
jgi:hypothetical protein